MISDAAKNTGRVFLTSHAKLRMRERKINRGQVFDCLLNGVVSEPAHVNMHGNWQCTLTRLNAGDEVSVAAALDRADDGNWIVVITAF